MTNKLAGGRALSGLWKTVTDAFTGFGSPKGVIPGTAGDPSVDALRSDEAKRIQQIADNIANLRDRAGADKTGEETFVNEPVGGSSKKARCDRIIGTAKALQQSAVLSGGLTATEISASKGLRSCLYARETEFSSSKCREKLKQADSIIGQAGGTVETYKKASSSIDNLIRELGQSGECPEVLNVLQGSSGGTSPTLALKRNSDVNPVPSLKNVLNDYIDVQYHISLSMVPEVEARRLQTRIGRAESRIENDTIDDLRQTVRQSGSVTLASTGESERNLVSVVEEPVSEQQIENIDEALYKTGRVQQIQAGMQKLANLWRRSIPSGGTSTFTPNLAFGGDATKDFLETANRTAKLALDIREEREQDITDLINAVQNSDNIATGERVSRDVSNRNYYAIKSMKISNVHAPEYHDPFVSNLTSMEMILQEPHGLNLNEDLVTLSRTLGYRGINPGRILYKVDVWFSGYNPKTGEWVQNIDFRDRGSNNKPIVSYYVVMTGVEGNFTTTGTEYKLSFAPQGLMAIRPEEFSLEGMSIPTGGNPTLGTFLNNLAEALKKKRSEETKEDLGGIGVHRTYKFYVPDVLKEASFYQGAFLERYNMVSEDNKDGAFITIGKDVDILTLLRSVLADLPEVQTAFLTNKDNEDFVKPVVHFTVRFNVRYATRRPDMHDYDGIIYEYIIEPFLSYKKLGFNAKNIYKYTNPQSQMRRIQSMLNLGMITRVYDYLNTSENTDVINFDVKLNRFYFETFKRSFDPGARKGLGTASTPAQIEEASNVIGLKRELDVNLDFATDPALADRFSPDEESLLRKVFGNNVDNMAGSGGSGSDSVTAGFETLQGSLNTTNDPDSYTSTISDGDTTKTKDEYLQRFNDHFSIDLLSLEGLELRGDPIWLLTPYASANSNILLSMTARDTQTNEPINGILQPHGEKVIFLNIKDVKQYDFMDPERGSTRERGKPSIMAGFYGIFGSDSTFEDGKFTQSLRGYKMAHLNYAGENMIVDNLANIASKADLNSPNDDLTQSEWITQVLDQAQKLPQYSDKLSESKEAKRSGNTAPGFSPGGGGIPTGPTPGQ